MNLNLQKIEKVKTQLEIYQESLYLYQEALVSGNDKAIERYSIDFIRQSEKLHEISVDSILSCHIGIICKEVAIKKLLSLTCQCAGVTEEEMAENKECRKRKYVTPRQVYIALLHKTFEVKQESSIILYGKDHSTVINCYKKVRNFYQTEPVFRKKYKRVFDFCIAYDLTVGEKRTLNYLTKK